LCKSHICCPQVHAADVKIAALTATGGASGVGASIAEYVLAANADLVVVGSRGLHGWQRYVKHPTWQSTPHTVRQLHMYLCALNGFGVPRWWLMCPKIGMDCWIISV
jgi:hypothetical protein